MTVPEPLYPYCDPRRVEALRQYTREYLKKGCTELKASALARKKLRRKGCPKL